MTGPGRSEGLLLESEKILDKARERRVPLRLIGALAFLRHCPRFSFLQRRLQRELSDIDFVSYSGFFAHVNDLFASLGYEEERGAARLFQMSGVTRTLLRHKEKDFHIDIFFDQLQFCHEVPFKGLLELDFPTAPLSVLLLEKLQIVEIERKDFVDLVMLIREHAIGESDDEVINFRRIATLCSNDWGLWRTVTANLGKLKNTLSEYALDGADVMDISNKIDEALLCIEKERKSSRWRLRSVIGDKVRWHKAVGEVYR